MAVVEGCGDNGCEYMTGGVAVILGKTGGNFGAGMTGGMAYIYDPEKRFHKRANMETLVCVPVSVAHWQAQLKGLIEAHFAHTNSEKAGYILNRWEEALANFVQVCPKEMLIHLPHPISEQEALAIND